MGNEIVFIAGCGHSGSTLLELILSGHPDCVGIGEAYQLLQPIEKIQAIFEARPRRAVCACGETIYSCSFWAHVYRLLIRDRSLTPDQKYVLFLDRAREQFGSRYIVDSSKSPQALTYLHRSNASLRVLHVTKDVRAYVTSMRRAYQRIHGPRVNRALDWKVKGLKYLQASSWWQFRNWYRTNRTIDTYLDRYGIPVLRISYEDLCFSASSVVDEICRFLGISYQGSMLALEHPVCHNLFGNRMKTQRSKKSHIKYDYDWLYDQSWLLPSIVCRSIMLYNRQRSAPSTRWETEQE